EQLPPRALAAYVERLWVHAVPNDLAAVDGGEHRVLPDDAASLVFWCRRDADGRVAESRFGLLGPVRAPRLYANVPGHEMTAVKLRAEWVAPLLGASADDHADALSDVDAFAPRPLGTVLRAAHAGLDA